MKFILLTVCLGLSLSSCNQGRQQAKIITSDIDLFWKAYDRVVASSDSIFQHSIIQKEYIDQGSEGLKLIMKKRGYTASSYLDAIRSAPSFWNSIRHNTQQAETYASDINKNIEALKLLYPDMGHANIYFTIGAMMTAGSAYKGHVLIGAELAMADSNAVSIDIENEHLRENLGKYFKSNPKDDLVLLNVHEYVHTQQGGYGKDLLSMSIFEGIAEFISVLAAKVPSASPAISYGQANVDKVRERFQKEMFSPHWNDWLYNNTHNEFGVRDLGYYVGYEICERYYMQAESKSQAIKEIIELDCTSTRKVRAFLEKTGYLSRPYEELRKNYEAQKPEVLGIAEFENGSKSVGLQTTKVSILFSKEMNTRFRNFKLGNLGENNLLPIENVTWAADKRSLILDVSLEADKRYQIVVDSEIRDVDGRPIDQYKIDFRTSAQ